MPAANKAEEAISEIREFLTSHSSIEDVHAFARKGNSVSHKALLADLLGIFISEDGGHKDESFFDDLSPMFESFICNSSSFTDDTLSSSIVDLEFSRFLPRLCKPLHAILKKIKNKEEMVPLISCFISKIHSAATAMWLIDEIHFHFKTESDEIKSFSAQIISLLANSSRRLSAAYLIYQAATSEADFFRIGEAFEPTQIFSVSQSSEPPFSISFNPIFSSRRIYAELASHSCDLSKVSLAFLDGAHEILLPFGCPLSSLKFSSSPIQLVVSQSQSDAEILPTPFLSFFSDHSEQLYSSISDDYPSTLVFKVMSLFPLRSYSPPTFPLQALIQHKPLNPMQFESEPSIFAFSVALADTSSDLKNILEIASSRDFDAVSFLIICRALSKFKAQDPFSPEFTRKCLIEHGVRLFRSSFRMLLPPPSLSIVSFLLPFTALPQNRHNSSEFFDYAVELPESICLSVFKSLQQFEQKSFSDSDETFKCLLKHIPVNNDTIRLVFQRLFECPTPSSPFLPFLQVPETRDAALTFLCSTNALPLFMAQFSLVPVSAEPPLLIPDLTYKGRMGIINLGSTCYVNSLIQAINAMPHIVAFLLSIPDNKLSPLIIELRNILALERYGRGTPLSLGNLTATLPDFQNDVQEDAEEFMNMLLNRMCEDLKSPEELAGLLKGRLRSEIHGGENVLSSHEEDFFYISLQTKGIENIAEAAKRYFADEPIEGGYTVEGSKEKVEAVRSNWISKFPKYFIVQLQRWEYASETMERSKIVSEFQFPIMLTKSQFQQLGDLTYELSAVILHEGDTESGHYTAIVRGEDGYWYFCNDDVIEFFDVGHLGTWAFGGMKDGTPNESVRTGYLLFYGQSGMDPAEFKLCDDVERIIADYNRKSWPSVILASEQVLSFIQTFIEKSLFSEESVCLGLEALLKIATSKESVFENFKQFFIQKVLSSADRAKEVWIGLKSKFGQSLSIAVSVSDDVFKGIEEVLEKIILLLQGDSSVIIDMIGMMDVNVHKRVANLRLDIIDYTCKLPSVRWEKEAELLAAMASCLSQELQKDTQRALNNLHFEVFEDVVSILMGCIKYPGFKRPIGGILNPQLLSRILPQLRKSDIFPSFLVKIENERPELLSAAISANGPVKSLISNSVFLDADEEEDIEADFIVDVVPSLLYCDNEDIKASTCEILSEAIECQNNLIPSIANLIPEATSSLHNGCTAAAGFITTIVKASAIDPNSLLPAVIELLNCIPVIIDKSIVSNLVEILRNVSAADKTIIKKMSADSIHTLCQIQEVNETLIDILPLMQLSASGSPLAIAVATYCLSNPIDARTAALIPMMEDGFDCVGFRVPSECPDGGNLAFANALWGTAKSEELSKYMIKAVGKVEPFFRCTSVIKRTLKILKEFCQFELPCASM